MGSPSPILLDLPAANHLAAPGFIYECRQPELGALHSAVRTGWQQVKALAGRKPRKALPSAAISVAQRSWSDLKHNLHWHLLLAACVWQERDGPV
jgi:hypothetical protein